MSIYGNTTKFPMTPFVFDNIYTDDNKDEDKKQYTQMTDDVKAGVYLANRYLLYKVTDEDSATGEVKYLYGQVFRVVANKAGPQIELVATLNAPSFSAGKFDFASEGLDPKERIKGDSTENKIDIVLPENGNHLTFQLNFTINSIGKMCSDIWDMLLGTNRNGYLDGWDDSYFNSLGGAIGALYNLMGKEQIKTIEEGNAFPPSIENPEDYIYYIASGEFGLDYYHHPIEANQYYYLAKKDFGYLPVKLEGFAGGMQNLYKDLVNIKQLMGFFDPDTENTETVQGCINKINALIEDPNIKLLTLEAINIIGDEMLNKATINFQNDDDRTYQTIIKSDNHIFNYNSINISTDNEANEIILSGVGRSNGIGEAFGVNTQTLDHVPLYDTEYKLAMNVKFEQISKDGDGEFKAKVTSVENCYFRTSLNVTTPEIVWNWNLYDSLDKDNPIGDITPITNIEKGSNTFYGKISLRDRNNSINNGSTYRLYIGVELLVKESLQGTITNTTEEGTREELILGTNSAEGYNTIATNVTGQKIIGKYNDYKKRNVLFAVGNGTSDDDRSNAFTVYKDGSIEIGNQLQNVILEDRIESPGNTSEGIDGSFIRHSAIAAISGRQFKVYGIINAPGVRTDVRYAPDWTKLLEAIKKTNGVQIENIYNICLTPISQHIITLGRNGDKVWGRLAETDPVDFYFAIEGYVSTWGSPISDIEEE